MFLINIIVPVIAGLVYFFMAAEVRRVSHIRKLIFGEIGYKKIFNAFMMLGFYFATRPLQNLIGPHPWPLIVNCARQFFLMAVIAPSVFVGVLHWVPNEKGTPKSVGIAAYGIGAIMALIFVVVNSAAIAGSKEIASLFGMKIYDAVWFTSGLRPELVLVHLFSQLVSPVGFFLMSAAYVRHRRYNYPLSNVYNQMQLKWKYLETGLLIFALSFIVAGFAVLLGQYYTYLWVIYFAGAIVAGVIETIGVKIPPREAPADLKDKH